jgi:hypothetical protein
MAIQRITSGIIADGAIVATDIGDGVVTASKIADANVTSSKLASTLSISGNFLANNITANTNIVANTGSAAAPSIFPTGDTNTGIFFPAADTIAFAEGGAEAMRIDSSGNLLVGTTNAAPAVTTSTGIALSSTGYVAASRTSAGSGFFNRLSTDGEIVEFRKDGSLVGGIGAASGGIYFGSGSSNTERARITSDGDLLVGKTSGGLETAGFRAEANGTASCTRSENLCLAVNRLINDGTLVSLRQDSIEEGTISVSGSTVSYNGGHLSRWAQMLTKPDLLKGTVMSNLDEMNVYVDADGNPVENEQLNKVKVSDVEGDANVAGVFVNWTYDEAHQVDEINMAMTGDMIIRIAQGTTVARGDLLMSAGDGTAKPQGDDIVRSKTIAKVTSTHVTYTYDDGSYCVPCVLMAC